MPDLVGGLLDAAQGIIPGVTMPAVTAAIATTIAFKKLTTKQVAAIGIVFWYAASDAGGCGDRSLQQSPSSGAGVVMIVRLADHLRGLLDLLARLGPGSRVLLLRIVARFGWKVTGAVLAAALNSAPRHLGTDSGACGYCSAGVPQRGPTPFPTSPAEDHVEDADAPVEEGPAGPDRADVADVVRDVIGTGRGALLTGLRSPSVRPIRRPPVSASTRPVSRSVRGCARPTGTGPAFTATTRPPLTPLRPTHRSVLLPQARTPTPTRATACGWRSERG
ncbi:hypothetical protein WDA79_04225 [Streptomyces sp. A475]|uniref:hypothetical protein n=1 Tax=unclassified Streptomyces TaxID=2593676 RepID=UPI0030C9AF1E